MSIMIGIGISPSLNTGGGLQAPAGYAFVVDYQGRYYVDYQGRYYIRKVA